MQMIIAYHYLLSFNHDKDGLYVCVSVFHYFHPFLYLIFYIVIQYVHM